MLGDNCASSCTTRNHETWGACRRANGLRIGYCRSAAGYDRTEQKRWDKNLTDYAKARKDGIQPRSTWKSDVDMAVQKSDETGEAYQAKR